MRTSVHIATVRQARIRGVGKSYYHCLSRVVDRNFVLHDGEKEHFVALMRELEAFHGMRVVTYCIMSNHFHLLIKEPDEETVQSLELAGQISGSGENGTVLSDSSIVFAVLDFDEDLPRS